MTFDTRYLFRLDREIQILKKFFQFDHIFNLLDYDQDMFRLYEDLKKLQKESYEPNYRFIFAFYDTDYHLANQPGITLRNLQRILRTLDISNFFCLILTQKNLARDLEILRKEETNDDCAISYIQHGLQDLLHCFENPFLDVNIDKIEKKFIFLSNTKRCHKTLLMAMMNKEDIIDNSLIGFSAYK